MAYIESHARDQGLLLPASVEDYVSAHNPVRFIDAFVDDLDLGEAGFHRSRPKATGRPGYDPGDMLKLYLYGYLNRVRSSRRLEAETTCNLDLIGCCAGCGRTTRPLPTSVAITGVRSRQCSAPSLSCVASFNITDDIIMRYLDKHIHKQGFSHSP